MKKLHILNCQPDDLTFWWQSLVQLNNARELGISDKFRLLIFTPPDRQANGINPKWKELEGMFPESKFFYYFDEADIMRDIGSVGYIPLLRPYMLARHFKDFPELVNDAIFYIDGDVLFTKPIDWIDSMVDDDVNYLSDTKGYLNSDYFDSKIKDVSPDKLEEYKKIDVLATLSQYFGISREICEKNKDCTGGAQSLLKNVDYRFWQDVYSGSIVVRKYLRSINTTYFPSEDKGFQSWAADMWSLIFNLWKRGATTSTPKEMDFAWATDSIDRIEKVNIFHNAGITGSKKLISSEPGDRVGTRIEVDCPAFYKGAYVNNDKTPFNDVEYLESVVNNEISRKFCTYYYVQAILTTKEKFKL